METNTIRPASEDDLERIVEIEAASSAAPWSRESFAKEIDKPHSHFWVITDDESDTTIFAFAVFSLVGDQAYIQEIAVDPRLRGHGFGAQMLRAIIAFTLRQKGTSVYLEVRKSNADAIAFYQHMGFIVVDTKSGYYSDGEDAYAMSFRLKEAAGESEDA